MKENMTALVLRHIPERVPRTKAELADIYLTESNKIETDRMKSRERKRDDDEVVNSRYDPLIADKEAQLTELQNEIEKLRHEMFGQLLYASLEEERRNQELADRRKVLDMWFETMRNRIEKEQGVASVPDRIKMFRRDMNYVQGLMSKEEEKAYLDDEWERLTGKEEGKV